jgi:hypothetical protein
MARGKRKQQASQDQPAGGSYTDVHKDFRGDFIMEENSIFAGSQAQTQQ